MKILASITIIAILGLASPAIAQTTQQDKIVQIVENSETLSGYITTQNKQTVKDLSTEFLDHLYGWLEKGGDKVGKAAEKAGDFAIEQTPILCHEIIYYGIATNTIRVLCDLIISIIGLIFIYKSFKNKNGFFEDGEPNIGFFGAIIGIMMTLCGFVSVYFDINSLIMPLFAPRLYLLQEIGKLIKQLS